MVFILTLLSYWPLTIVIVGILFVYIRRVKAEQRRTETALKEIESRYQSLLDYLEGKIPVHLGTIPMKFAQTEQKTEAELDGVLKEACTVCHGLNQPLQAASGYVQILLYQLDKENPIYETIAKIDGQMIRMGKISRTLMGLIRDRIRDDGQAKFIDIDRNVRANQSIKDPLTANF